MGVGYTWNEGSRNERSGLVTYRSIWHQKSTNVFNKRNCSRHRVRSLRGPPCIKTNTRRLPFHGIRRRMFIMSLNSDYALKLQEVWQFSCLQIYLLWRPFAWKHGPTQQFWSLHVKFQTPICSSKGFVKSDHQSEEGKEGQTCIVFINSQNRARDNTFVNLQTPPCPWNGFC